MRLRWILLALVGVALSFWLTLSLIDWLSPQTAPAVRTANLAPLPPAARRSTIIAPVNIALSAIRDTVERAAPRDFSGKGNNPVGQVLSQADIGWTIGRGPVSAAGNGGALVISTPLLGTLNVTGSLASAAGNIGGSLGNFLNSNLGKEIKGLAGNTFSAKADIKGSVVVSARPAILANWRIEPNLSGQVTVGDTNVAAAGLRIGVPAQVKPLLDQTVNEQIAAVQARIRNDTTLEQTARQQWAKMCRSIPLPGAAAGLPDLWLEMRPVKALAAQPRVDANNLVLTLGVEAETRVVASETKPTCPFPASLDLVPPLQDGQIAVGVPIDMAFTAVNKILEAQIKGRSFPEDGSGSIGVTVKGVRVTPSGDRLLISLLVNAKERKSFFGFGADATIQIWGHPVLDQQQQTLRLADTELAVESEAAFGLLGAAARAAMPYLQASLTKNAVIDLKPFAAGAKQKIDAALADFRTSTDGLRVNADVTDLQLVGIAFDANTLRIIADARGKVNVALTKFSAL
jgi:hypothetical protein